MEIIITKKLSDNLKDCVVYNLNAEEIKVLEQDFSEKKVSSNDKKMNEKVNQIFEHHEPSVFFEKDGDVYSMIEKAIFKSPEHYVKITRTKTMQKNKIPDFLQDIFVSKFKKSKKSKSKKSKSKKSKSKSKN